MLCSKSIKFCILFISQWKIRDFIYFETELKPIFFGRLLKRNSATRSNYIEEKIYKQLLPKLQNSLEGSLSSIGTIEQFKSRT